MIVSRTEVEWQDCETSAPDADITVLVYDGDDVVPGYKEGPEWYRQSGSEGVIRNARLWAHIPFPEQHEKPEAA